MITCLKVSGRFFYKSPFFQKLFFKKIMKGFNGKRFDSTDVKIKLL